MLRRMNLSRTTFFLLGLLCVVALAAPLAAQDAPPAPPADAPKTDAPKTDEPKIGPAADTPKTDAPKTEPAKEPAPIDPESYLQYALGLDHLKAGRLDDAITAFKKAAELDPTSVKILRDLAAAQRSKGDLAAANATTEKIVAIDPANTEALYQLADSASTRGRLDEAEAYYKKILAVTADVRQDRFFGLALVQYAEMLSRRDRDTEAADVLLRLVKWLKDTPESMSRDPQVGPLLARQDQYADLAASLYVKAGQIDKAVEIIRGHSAGDLEYHYKMARVLQSRGKSEEAEKEFKAVIAVEGAARQNRSYGLALYSYARLLEDAKRGSESAEVLERLIRWLKDVPQALAADRDVAQLVRLRPQLVLTVVQAHLRSGKPEKAVEIIREAGGELLDEPAFGELLVLTLLRDNKADLALDVARDMQKRRPQDGVPYRLITRIYEQKKDNKGLAAEFREFLKATPDSVVVQLLLGRALLAAGQADEGAKIIEDLLARDDTLAAEGVETLVPLTVGSLLEHKKPELALKAALAAVKRWPEARESYTMVARVFEELKDDQKFIQVFRTLHDEHPKVTAVTLLLGGKLLETGQADEGRKLIEPLLKGDAETARDARSVLLDHFKTGGQGEQAVRLFAESITDVQAQLQKAEAEIDKPDRREVALRDMIRYGAALDDLVKDLARYVDGLKDLKAVAEACRATLDVAGSTRKRTVGADFVLGMVHEPFDRQKAEAYYEKALETSNTFAPAYERRLAMLIGLDRLAEALSLLGEAAVRVKSRRLSDEFLQTRGVLFELLGRDSDAIGVYTTALRLNSQDTGVRFSLLRVLLRSGQTEEAGYVVEQALANWPEEPNVYIDASHYHAMLKHDLAAGLAMLDKGLSRLSEDPKLMYFKVPMLQRAKRYDEALALCDKLDTINEGLKDMAGNLRVGVLLNQKKYAEAEAILQEMIAREPEEPDHAYYLAGLYGDQGDEAKAEKALRDLLARFPRHTSVCNDLGYLLADRGVELDDAERMIRIAVQETPSAGAYLDSLAWVLYKRNRMDEALEYIQRSMRMESNADPVMFDHQGDILVRLNRLDEARQAYQKAAELLRDADRHPSRDDEKVRTSLEKKLDAIRKGKDVPTAPLGRGIK